MVQKLKIILPETEAANFKNVSIMKKLFLIGLVLGLLTNGNCFSQGVSSDQTTTLNTSAPYKEQASVTNNANFSYNVHCNVNSNYMILEVYGLQKMQLFEIKDQSGNTVYSGGLTQSQIIETSTWKSGIYYVYLANKVERFVVSK